MLRTPTDKEESKLPETVVVVCVRSDLDGTAPFGNDLLLMRLPLLPPSNSITNGRYTGRPWIVSQHNNVMGAKSLLYTLPGVGIQRPPLNCVNNSL